MIVDKLRLPFHQKTIMGIIKHEHLIVRSSVFPLEMDGTVVRLNKHGSVSCSYVKADIYIGLHEKSLQRYARELPVITAPPGAKVLPYFWEDNAWHVILVEQFRIALPGNTVEAAGGEANEQHIRTSMAAELLEETGITVNPERIQVVSIAYIQPSILNAKAYGGIVKIEPAQIPSHRVSGEWQQGEYTILTARPLLSLLRSMDDGTFTTDLETRVLLTALARRTGYLVANY